jgi:MFS family permease
VPECTVPPALRGSEAPAIQSGLGGRFRRFASAYAAVALADGIRTAALPLLAASITSDPIPVAAVAFSETLPWLVIGLASGVVVDLRDRRVVMLVAAFGRILLMVLVMTVILVHLVSIDLLIIAGFLLGSLDTFSSNSAVGLIARLVPEPKLERANGLIGGIDSVGTSLVGPAVGSLLFAVTRFLPFSLDAGMIVIAISLLISLRGDFRAARTPGQSHSTRLRSQLTHGMVWLWHLPPLRTLALIVAVGNLATGMFGGVLVLFVLHVMHLPQATYGALVSCLAVGGLLGATLAGRIGSKLLSPCMLALFLIAEAAGLFAMAVHPIVVVVVIALVAIGAGSGTRGVIIMSFRQRVVPDALLGRVTSAFRVIGVGAAPLGVAIGGVLAGLLGLRCPYYVGAGTMALAALAALVFLRTSDLTGTP